MIAVRRFDVIHFSVMIFYSSQLYITKLEEVTEIDGESEVFLLVF